MGRLMVAGGRRGLDQVGLIDTGVLGACMTWKCRVLCVFSFFFFLFLWHGVA